MISAKKFRPRFARVALICSLAKIQHVSLESNFTGRFRVGQLWISVRTTAIITSTDTTRRNILLKWIGFYDQSNDRSCWWISIIIQSIEISCWKSIAFSCYLISRSVIFNYDRWIRDVHKIHLILYRFSQQREIEKVNTRSRLLTYIHSRVFMNTNIHSIVFRRSSNEKNSNKSHHPETHRYCRHEL